MEKQIKIEIDTEYLDEALEKARELSTLLKETEQILHSLSPKPKD